MIDAYHELYPRPDGELYARPRARGIDLVSAVRIDDSHVRWTWESDVDWDGIGAPNAFINGAGPIGIVAVNDHTFDLEYDEFLPIVVGAAYALFTQPASFAKRVRHPRTGLVT